MSYSIRRDRRATRAARIGNAQRTEAGRGGFVCRCPKCASPLATRDLASGLCPGCLLSEDVEGFLARPVWGGRAC